MTHSLLQQSFNHNDLANEWEEAFQNKTNNQSHFSHYNAIFSDDEEDEPQNKLTSRWLQPENNLIPCSSSGYIDPVLSSSTYHIHQADNALLLLKHVVLEDGWKKALKHKSGVIVHMKNGIHKGDKTPIFKGEAIIQGFSPQAIFYVIGMRKLWDEQYEDGNLVENLNDTTSLTYEVMKPTTTSKSRDLALVEKIECTQNGAIVFACTSVETPRIPRMSGRTRVNTKLQGWILEPLQGGPNPATKVVFVVQESMKGWVPGFAKKTLARRPLVIAKVAEYLERKTERMRNQPVKSNQLQAITSGHSRRPSVMSNTLPLFNHNRLPPVAPPHESNQHSILLSSTLPSAKKHIKFIDTIDQDINSNSSTTTESSPQSKPSQLPPVKQHLYPSHRHPIQKVESIQLLKKLTFSNDNWSLTKESGTNKHYVLNSNILTDDDELMNYQGDLGITKRKVPFIRADGVIQGGWTAEQLCSVIHCFGSRKIWDTSFEGGQTVERFSQKEYLVQWYLSSSLPIANVDLSAITSIESDPITGTVYTATSSVVDQQVPPDETGHRIRAYSDLYGWVFRPKFDQQGRTLSVGVSFVCNMDFKYTIPNQVLQSWIDSMLESIVHVDRYLTNYGCPPYIRRIAGKVVREDFDANSSKYEIVFIVKHQPSNSYRARKQNQQTVWCTDIRVHKTMFPHGLDIRVVPEHAVRIEVSPKDQRSIKIFTMDEAMEGKQMTFTLQPLLDGHSATYKVNDKVFNPKQSLPVIEPVAREPVVRELAVKKSVLKEPVNKAATLVTEPPVSPAAPIITAPAEQAKTPLPVITTTTTTVTTEAEIIKDETSTVPLKLPQGYLLVPEHQNNNIIMITDDLSFNGQQISVIFLAMVICYYMGKFTSCSSC